MQGVARYLGTEGHIQTIAVEVIVAQSLIMSLVNDHGIMIGKHRRLTEVDNPDSLAKSCEQDLRETGFNIKHIAGA